MRRFSSLFALGLLLATPVAARQPDLPDRFAAGMVSAADPRAAEAGAQMLRQGGTATDAALATLLALTVVEPQSSGIGGGGFYLADDGHGRVDVIDGRETAPAAATPDWFKAGDAYLAFGQIVPGGRSVGVPGNVSLMAKAHRRHGALPWKDLFSPAIRLARDGFAITPRFHDFLIRSRDKAGFTAQGRALFYAADGAPLPVGTTVRNPALADFLDRLARKGARAFYRGENARAIVGAVRGAERGAAPMTRRDLAGYAAQVREPVCFTYRLHRLCGMGPPSSGATTVFGVLGLIERFDMAALGKDSATAWHLIIEAQRLTYADRERYLADPAFVSVPVAGLLAPEYLAQRSGLIAIDRTLPTVTAGTPPGAVTTQADAVSAEVPSTSHFAVIDRKGRAATLTSTIEGPFGSGLMANGYYLNNELTDFSIVPERDGKPVANRVEAGKRPRSSMSPTLVYAPDGSLRMAIGAAGGATIPAQVVKAIIGVIDWKLSARDAIALPVVFAPGGSTVFVEQGSPHEALVPALQALGHADVRLRTPSFKANAVEVVDGKLIGAADPRSEGLAVAE
ncbi:MAG: gamma-glutamyltransferase [Novosphingobium sp.]